MSATVTNDAAAGVTVNVDMLMNGNVIPNGQGMYDVMAVFTPSATSEYLGSEKTESAQIYRERMALSYDGTTFFNTNKVGGTATVTVSALVTEDADGELGSLLPWKNSPVNLKVKFTIYVNSPSSPSGTCTVPVEQTAAQQAAGTGVAGCSFSGLKENVYTAHMELVETMTTAGTTARDPHSYYEADEEDIAINVVDPGTGFTTGGGWIIDPNTDRRSNFGFTAKFLKNGSVQGNSLFIYRRTVNLYAMGVTTAPNEVRAYNFWIKSNAMDGLQQKCSTGAGAEPCWATITGKSNVKAIDRVTGTEYTLGADIIGNQQFFQVDVTDNGEPGSQPWTLNGPDRYAIRVWTSQGTFYQVGIPRTSFDGTPNGTQIGLSGGNIQVRLKK